ncbi:hypothetical protein MUK42_02439 [Musa troglodytarum]|uniref:Uncharacterized protein n=1 Tax=Musa troglodytarum TaxID=320322 RepID=A0A9E7ELF1_9LILI|nr:hypothetical protein MUK42_02439 [Musa troglodytarum]
MEAKWAMHGGLESNGVERPTRGKRDYDEDRLHCRWIVGSAAKKRGWLQQDLDRVMHVPVPQHDVQLLRPGTALLPSLSATASLIVLATSTPSKASPPPSSGLPPPLSSPPLGPRQSVSKPAFGYELHVSDAKCQKQVEPCMWRMEDEGLDHLVVMGGPAIGSVIILGSAPDWLHEEERPSRSIFAVISFFVPGFLPALSFPLLASHLPSSPVYPS